MAILDSSGRVICCASLNFYAAILLAVDMNQQGTRKAFVL